MLSPVVQNNYNRGGWRGRSRGRGRGFVPRNKNTLKFEKDYDFEQANTQFEELRIQLAKTKIADGDVKTEVWLLYAVPWILMGYFLCYVVIRFLYRILIGMKGLSSQNFMLV